MAIAVCTGCSEEKKIHAKGLCNRCCMRDYRKRNPDYNKLTLRRWYAKNRERAQHDARQRYWADPMKRFADACNKSANRSGKAGTLARDKVESLFTEQLANFPAGRCSYCNSIVAPGCNATLDHIDPKGTHTMENVVLSCTSCNSSRQTAPVEEFRARLASDEKLLEHVKTRNKARIAGFLVARYDLEIEEILGLVAAKREPAQ